MFKDDYLYTLQRKGKLHGVTTAVLVLTRDFYFNHKTLLTAAFAQLYSLVKIILSL